MREYIITMSVTAIIASVLELFAPTDLKKYIQLGIGLVIMSVLLAPLPGIKNAKISAPQEEYQLREKEFYDLITTELKQNVERDIEERLLKEFGIESTARVDIDIDDENNIKGVNTILVYTEKNAPKIAERLEDVYGCHRIEIRVK